jgi:hypothetical protein
MKAGQCEYCLTQYENTHEGHARLGRCRKRCDRIDENKRYAEVTNNETWDTLYKADFTHAQIDALVKCFGEK